MSAVQALGAARALGVHLEADGDDLLLEALGPPPDTVLAALSRHKPEVVRLLHSAKDGSSPEYWHILLHQRAAFAEFAGGLPRPDAEAQAFECCVVEWLNRNRRRLEQVAVCGAANPKPMALSSYLTVRSPGATLGYTRNAGQRGRNSVDLRRERLSLKSVSAVYRTTAAYAVAVVVHQRITAAVKDAACLKKRTGKNGSQYARKQHSRSIQRTPRWIGDTRRCSTPTVLIQIFRKNASALDGNTSPDPPEATYGSTFMICRRRPATRFGNATNRNWHFLRD